MSKVFSADVWICASVYVVADSEAEAITTLQAMHQRVLELPVADDISQSDEPAIAIYGGSYEPDMPEVSLSPAMTLYGPLALHRYQLNGPATASEIFIDEVESFGEEDGHDAHVDELLNDAKGG